MFIMKLYINKVFMGSKLPKMQVFLSNSPFRTIKSQCSSHPTSDTNTSDQDRDVH